MTTTPPDSRTAEERAEKAWDSANKFTYGGEALSPRQQFLAGFRARDGDFSRLNRIIAADIEEFARYREKITEKDAEIAELKESHREEMKRALRQDLELSHAVKTAEANGIRPEIAFAVYHTKRRYRATIDTLKAELAAKDAEIAEWKTKETAFENAKFLVVKLSEEITALKAQRDTLKAELAALHADLAAMQSQRDELTAELSEARRMTKINVEIYCEEINALKSQRDVTKEANEGWAKRCTALEAELADLRKRGEFLREALERIKKGTHDPTPTCMSMKTPFGVEFGPPRTGGWQGYVTEIIETHAEIARAALADSQKGDGK